MENTENKVRYNENVNIKTGRIGFVDIVTTASNKRIAKISLYVSEIAGPKGADGKYPTKKTAFRITVFEGNKNCIPFDNLKVGDTIRCVGRDEIRQYTNKHGETAYSQEIIAFETTLVSEGTKKPADAPATDNAAPAAPAAPATPAASGDDEALLGGNENWDDEFFNQR